MMTTQQHKVKHSKKEILQFKEIQEFKNNAIFFKDNARHFSYQNQTHGTNHTNSENTEKTE